MSQRSLVTVAVSLLLGAASFDARAQDVKAWETAINYMQDDKGCLSIPYSDGQTACHRKQNEVVNWCKTSGAFNCGSVDPKQFQRNIEKLKLERDEINNERARLNDLRSREKDDRVKQDLATKIAAIEARLTVIASERAALERRVLDDARACTERLSVAKACRDSRMNVQEVFRDVIRRANSETDPKVVPLAKRLIAEWTVRYQKHEEEVSVIKRAVEICEQVLYEIGRLGAF